MSELHAFLHELSTIARSVTSGVSVPIADNKAAAGAYDPVTELDRAAERALRTAIEARFPEDGIEGEEYGSVRSGARRRWLIDPIDGTRALICGLPTWTTLVALVDGEEPVAGFVDAPVLDELTLAVDGRTERGGARLRTSGCRDLQDARLSTTDYHLLGEGMAAFDRVRSQVRVTRYGLDALAYARVASGDLDLVIENGLKPHDWAALAPVVRGAGGVIGNWRGGHRLGEGDVVAAATQELFDEAIRALGA